MPVGINLRPFYERMVHIETAYLLSFIWNACFKGGDKVFDRVQDQILQPLLPLMQLVTTKGGGLPSAELLETGSFVFQKARQFTFANVNICKRTCWARADCGPPEGLEEALFTCSEECRPAQMLLYLSGTQGHSAGRDGPLCPSPKFPPHSINNKTQCGWPERRNWNSLLMLLRCSKAQFLCPLLPRIAWVRWFLLFLLMLVNPLLHSGQIQLCFRSCVCWMEPNLHTFSQFHLGLLAVSYQCGFHLRHWTPPQKNKQIPMQFV